MIHRQSVNVYASSKGTDEKKVKVTGKVVLPEVFATGIRTDIVAFVHNNMSKNRRQGHAVNFNAGMKHSAESWGTGRAVSRIPRVAGSGTNRNAQGAFGNMCRKGRMFAPIRIWRRWHRRVNIKQRRYAVATALAASAILPLVQARGHRVEQVPQLPLVINNSLEKIERTKEAVKFLKDLGAYADVKKVIETMRVRAGRGKQRNRRYRSRKGPLVVHAGANVSMIRAFRNVPGVETIHVSRLNLLQLAPGGHVGRFIIWTEDAFTQLSSIFGSQKRESTQKKGFHLPTHEVTNPDLGRVINSNEVQTAIRPVKHPVPLHHPQKQNPLNNHALMDQLNPNAKLMREAAQKANEENRKKHLAALAQRPIPSAA